MNTDICRMLGIEFPLFAFSHCRDVVAAVSRAGGFGVFGATRHTPETIRQELKWIDEHVDGKPYGLDLLIPENTATKGEQAVTWKALEERIPSEHVEFTNKLLATHGVALSPKTSREGEPQPFDSDAAIAVLREALTHYPVRLIANALGVPPREMIAMGKEFGIPVAALVGAKEHALRQIAAGVDVLVVQGTEAGGHCGEVSTLVLVPEVIKAVRRVSNVPVLAAGGIMNGRQMAACLAMGASGVWTGSVWLATTESETTEEFRQKMIAASSRDAIRSRGRTGKPARQLRSAWTDAWDSSNGPGPLPMPLQSVISRVAFDAIDRAASTGNTKALDLVSYFVGQGVGLVDQVESATSIVQQFKVDFADAVTSLNEMIESE